MMSSSTVASPAESPIPNKVKSRSSDTFLIFTAFSSTFFLGAKMAISYMIAPARMKRMSAMISLKRP